MPTHDPDLLLLAAQSIQVFTLYLSSSFTNNYTSEAQDFTLFTAWLAIVNLLFILDIDSDTSILNSLLRGPYDLPKSIDSFPNQLSHPHERHFRAFFRMGRVAFDFICRQLEETEAFRRSSRGRPQRSVKIQFGAYLRWFGSSSTTKHWDVARECGISTGSVRDYVLRSVAGLRELEGKWLQWPGVEARKEIAEGFDWPGCVGAVDGSLFPLNETPASMTMSYWCRKKFYGIAVQATVDHTGCFIEYDTGWGASRTDAFIWKSSRLWKYRRDYFSPNEYLLGDKGYPCSRYLVCPFSRDDLGQTQYEKTRRKVFNKKHSTGRMVVEHAFGWLKNRFPGTKMMVGEYIDEIYQGVISVMVVHNICLAIGDAAQDIPEFCDLSREERRHHQLEREDEAELLAADEREGSFTGETDALWIDIEEDGGRNAVLEAGQQRRNSLMEHFGL